MAIKIDSPGKLTSNILFTLHCLEYINTGIYTSIKINDNIIDSPDKLTSNILFILSTIQSTLAFIHPYSI